MTPDHPRDNSGVNVYSLVPALKVRVTPTRAYPSWQKPIAYIWEYGFDSLYGGLHTSYTSDIASMKDWHGKVDFSAGSCFQALEKCRYCIYSYRRLYILANQGSAIHATFASFLVPRVNGLNTHTRII